jgi:hypothetical protein
MPASAWQGRRGSRVLAGGRDAAQAIIIGSIGLMSIME